MTATTFAQRLLTWFDQHGRHDLPWQQDITPYRVWVSEIMLQQTQVTTVIPYYQRFMARFPSVQALAEAPQDDVLHHWTGLGYYARARNLHKAAQQVMAEHNGEFPDSVEQLSTLPGIGRSTAGAIRSIAFKKRAVILDGNVKRVLTRYRAIGGYPGTTAVANQLWQLAEQLTPKKRVADYTQAIMDLGATLCTRSKPACLLCPMQTDCQGHASGDPSQYPHRKAKKEKPVRETCLLILQNSDGDILLEKRPASGIWGGLWAFPECDTTADIERICQRYQCQPLDWEANEPRRHTFSHYHLDYTPVHVQVSATRQAMEAGRQVWYNPRTELTLGTAAPIARLLNELEKVAP
ncbi:A/G-specific adenine glycosylase [Porticoccus sp. W117]|uniref:A/G-specific adenine glycosylase n=1 Tax=Porticoccus sp. W117 TaxID=3054777 RepID=UPI0025938622|nr:A/G-specific adenine glycosylase [Porticoccus sp. W117]MDM3871828.1 A/G-specific adenine glycosylase [Porticoccus sp. W117]